MKKEFKANNKGFSLIELIIVVAIMAILIGILAPQYLRFVERSRVSSDRQNADELVRAVEIWSADTEAGRQKIGTPERTSKAIAPDSAGTTVTITQDADIVIESGKTNSQAITDAFESYGIDLGTHLRSTTWGGTVVLTFKVDSNFNVTVTDSTNSAHGTTGHVCILESN